MKVLANTNILFSALLYPNGGPGRALKHIATHHELVLSDYNISELRDIVARKKPDKMADVDVLLAELAYTLVIAPISPEKLIDDPKDAPVLNAAIVSEVDAIISGDAHFKELRLQRPVALTATEYTERYG
jgi:putative PIN family toxin of toxin-antitoxin system